MDKLRMRFSKTGRAVYISHLDLMHTMQRAIARAGYSLKYSEASKMDVIVRFQKNFVEVVIADDGKGCDEIRENNGIHGIRERIRKVNGTVSFASSAGEGFLTRVRIPV